MAGRVRPCRAARLAGLQAAIVGERAEAVAAMSAATSPRSDEAAAISAVTAVGQIAIMTSDLNRFRTFYEGLLGLPHVISLRMGRPPHLRYGVFAVGPDSGAQGWADSFSTGRAGRPCDPGQLPRANWPLQG